MKLLFFSEQSLVIVMLVKCFSFVISYNKFNQNFKNVQCFRKKTNDLFIFEQYFLIKISKSYAILLFNLLKRYTNNG